MTNDFLGRWSQHPPPPTCDPLWVLVTRTKEVRKKFSVTFGRSKNYVAKCTQSAVNFAYETNILIRSYKAALTGRGEEGT